MTLPTMRSSFVFVLLAVVALAAVALVLTDRPWIGSVTSAQDFDTAPDAEVPLRGPLSIETFRTVAEAQMPMVVNIRTESRRQTTDLSQFFDGPDGWRRFFGLPGAPQAPRPREQLTEAAGSGFVIDSSGLILTNNHVVQGATKIAVALYGEENGREYEARVVGRDPLTDSALIELTERPDHDLPAAQFGLSSSIKPGDWVVAIGNPFNLTHTVTVGIISAVGRPFPVAEGRWQDVLQTDAAINPGNSGGPLLNLRGEVVGINTAIYSNGPVAGNVGVGFAVPIDAVRELLPELRTGTVTRGRIGVQVTPITKELVEPFGLSDTRGALVRMVERDGPADKAGVEAGDVIVQYNGEPVEDSADLSRRVSRTAPGTQVPLTIVRDQESRSLNVTVDALDAGTAADQAGAADADALGLQLRDVTRAMADRFELPDGTRGALVTEVAGGSAADRAGLRAGDVLLEVNRQTVDGAASAARALGGVTPGDTAFVLLWRDGQRVFLPMTTERSR